MMKTNGKQQDGGKFLFKARSVKLPQRTKDDKERRGITVLAEASPL